jgi:hypothetical protein
MHRLVVAKHFARLASREPPVDGRSLVVGLLVPSFGFLL